MLYKNLLKLWLIIIFIFLYLPIIVLIIFSFDDSRFASSWSGFTLNWYIKLVNDTDLMLALANSLKIAFISVAIAAIMGTIAAYALTRFKFKGKSLSIGLIMLPIVVPEIAMGISSLVLFNTLDLPLSINTVIVSHIVFCVSYITLVVLARLEDFDTKLEEAAYDLGATPIAVFFKITLPLISPGILAGSLLAFILSLDDFIITQFTAGVGVSTIPLKIYSLVKFGVCPEINAMSTILILVTTSIAYLANRIIQKQNNLVS